MMTDELISYILNAIEDIAINGYRYLSQYSFDKENNQWLYKNFTYTLPEYRIDE